MVETAAVDGAHQHKEEVRAAVRAGAALTPTYALMNGLATVIACYGLLVDSPAGIIGAMVVAMLLGPIAGVSLALVEADMALLGRSLVAEMVGVAIVLATAFLLGLLHPDIPIGPEMQARTEPGSADLVIALAGGAAATIAAINGGVSVSLVGVAIATALVPPLSTGSMLVARGMPALAMGAFVLAFTNMVAIQCSASVIFWAAGYGPRTCTWSAGSRLVLHNTISVLLLVGLAILLGLSTHRAVRNMVFETTVRKTLRGAVQHAPGAYLAEVRFAHQPGQTIVRAVIRSPQPVSAPEVAAMEAQLPRAPDGSAIALRVRRIAVEVMTGTGPLLETDPTPSVAPHAESD